MNRLKLGIGTMLSRQQPEVGNDNRIEQTIGVTMHALVPESKTSVQMQALRLVPEQRVAAMTPGLIAGATLQSTESGWTALNSSRSAVPLQGLVPSFRETETGIWTGICEPMPEQMLVGVLAHRTPCEAPRVPCRC